MIYQVVYTRNKIKPPQLNYIKGAMNDVFPNPLWTNKDFDAEGVPRPVCAYSPVQYKLLRGHLAMVFIGEGMSLVPKYINGIGNLPLDLGGSRVKLSISETSTVNHQHQIDNRYHTYTSSNWIPMNTDNFLEFQSLLRSLGLSTDPAPERFDEIAVIQWFESILTDHIKTIIEVHEQRDSDGLSVRIAAPLKHGTVVYPNGTHVSRIGMQFMTNVQLSPHIGYGRRVQLGFGMMEKRRLRR